MKSMDTPTLVFEWCRELGNLSPYRGNKTRFARLERIGAEMVRRGLLTEERAHSLIYG